jgi:hypothetical protein
MTFPAQLLLGAPIGTTAGAVLGAADIVYPSDADLTLTTSGTAPQSTNNFLQVTSSGPLTATRKLIAPLFVGQPYVVQNNTTGGQAIEIIGPSGTGVLVPNGATVSVISDGTNYNSPQGGTSSTAGLVFAIRIPVGTTTVSSVAVIPAGAIVLRSYLDVETGYSGGATVQLGTAANPTLFQTVTTPQSIELFDNPQDTVNVTADPLRVTVAGGPTAGVAAACVEYVTPLS